MPIDGRSRGNSLFINTRTCSLLLLYAPRIREVYVLPAPVVRQSSSLVYLFMGFLIVRYNMNLPTIMGNRGSKKMGLQP
jgi:hypothetical protein